MRQDIQSIQQEFEQLQEKAEILGSILFAISVAHESKIHDPSAYTQAIHGALSMAYELIALLKQIGETISQE